MNMTAGDRSQNYQLAFTEPYLFDRNITGGFDFFKRSLDYIGYYTQKSAGGNLMFGVPVASFSRMFVSYSYESVKITNLNEALIDQSCLLSATGCGTISSVGDLSSLTPTQREVLARNPFVARIAAPWTGWQPDGQQGGPELRSQYRRQPHLPERGQEDHRQHRSGGAGRQYQLLQAALRVDLLQAPSAADVIRFPRPDGIHPFGWQSALLRRPDAAVPEEPADLRASDARRRVQHPRPRSCARSGRPCPARSPCSAATRACSSTRSI